MALNADCRHEAQAFYANEQPVTLHLNFGGIKAGKKRRAEEGIWISILLESDYASRTPGTGWGWRKSPFVV